MTISLARGFDRTIGVSGEPAAFHRTTSGVPGSGGARSKADIPTYDISGPEDLYTLNKRNRQLSSLSTSIAPLRLTTATLGEYQQRLSRAYAKPPSTLLQLGAREGVKFGAAKAAKYGIDKAFPGLLTQTMSLPPTYALSAPSAGASMTEVLKFASQPAGTAATGTTGLSAYSSFTSGAGAATTSGAGAATTGFSAGIGSTAAETLAMQSTRQTAVGLGGQTATLSYSSFMSLGQQGGQTAFTAAQAPVLNVPSLTSKGMTQAVSQEAALAASDQAALAAASKGGTQGGTKVISSQTMAKVNTALVYIQIGYDVYRFIDEPGPATGGAVVGAVIGTILTQGNPLGTAVGSFVGGFIGGLFGGGSKRYRRERQQRSFSGTAYGKSAFNTQRVQTATGGDNTTVLAVIEDDAYYHQGSGRYSQPITLPITTGNPQGFLDLEHRSAKELVQGLIGQDIDSGSGFGSAGRFLHTPPSASLGARTIDMFLRKMGKTDKADEFRALVLDGGQNEGHFYDNQPNLAPHTLDRDFNFLGEDTLRGASIQVFDNRFGITQDVIYGKAVAGRSKIQRRSETFPSPRTSQLRMFGRRAIYG
jgi:hypothetical protein